MDNIFKHPTFSRAKVEQNADSYLFEYSAPFIIVDTLRNVETGGVDYDVTFGDYKQDAALTLTMSRMMLKEMVDILKVKCE
jgi:hypothetical protein